MKKHLKMYIEENYLCKHLVKISTLLSMGELHNRNLADYNILDSSHSTELLPNLSTQAYLEQI